MSETVKIAALFWASWAVLMGGVLLHHFSAPTALIITGSAGFAFSAAWFILHLRDQS